MKHKQIKKSCMTTASTTTTFWKSWKQTVTGREEGSFTFGGVCPLTRKRAMGEKSICFVPKAHLKSKCKYLMSGEDCSGIYKHAWTYRPIEKVQCVTSEQTLLCDTQTYFTLSNRPTGSLGGRNEGILKEQKREGVGRDSYGTVWSEHISSPGMDTMADYNSHGFQYFIFLAKVCLPL